MEPRSEFDLEQAIHSWRAQLATSPAICSADLHELETHLRDSVQELTRARLSSREAFWVASTRLGSCDALMSEFGKVNMEQLWANRALWMVAGSLVIGLGSSLINGLVNYATLGLYLLTEQSSLIGPLSLLLHFGALAGLFLFLWRSGRNKEGRVWQAAGWVKRKPYRGALIAFLLTVLCSMSSYGSNMLWVKLSNQEWSTFIWWRYPTGVLLAFIWPVILGWLLARTVRKPKVA